MMVEACRCITYGDGTIEFEVIRSDRKTFGISVHPNQAVTVQAPMKALSEDIDQRVKHRAYWILRQQQYFSQFEPRTPPRQYVSGETHLYLGRQYRLKIQQSSHSAVKLKGRYLHIETPQPTCSKITRNLLSKWYMGRAQLKFNERLDACFTTFERLGFDRPALQIRHLSKRWGSLVNGDTVILNSDLIRAPSRHIDYVIMHELCHLKHANHNNAFFDLLSSLMPDWEKRKLKLEQILM